MKCQVKSKYLGAWQLRSIDIDSQGQCFLITKQQQTKRIYFNDITRCEISYSPQDKKYILILQFPSRSYQISAKKQHLQKVVDVIGLWNHFKHFEQIQEEQMPKPKVINYQQISKLMKKQQEQSEVYVPQYEDYYQRADWKRDKEKGGLDFINETKKGMQPKILRFLISKFISTGSFMGISFPVFAMKPQSYIQTYCRCISLAPQLLNGVKNPIERIKKFNCLIITLSSRLTDIDKSFNPVLGETFQSKIGNDFVYGQQISHHPPVSAFLLESEDFRLFGALEVRANLGINSARGHIRGDITCEFKDGGRIVGMIPCGILRGYLFGRYYFNPDGATYSYDAINKIVCSYNLTDKDLSVGQIGKLTNKQYTEFMNHMASRDEDIWKQKYEYFQHLGEKCFEKIYSRMEVVLTSHVSYDGKVYVNYEQECWRPPKLNKQSIIKALLPSDSRFRKDIHLRLLEKIEESQQQKERIQNQERGYQRLRKQYNSH